MQSLVCIFYAIFELIIYNLKIITNKYLFKLVFYVKIFEILYFMSKYTRRESRKHRYLIHVYSDFYYLQQNKKKLFFISKYFPFYFPLQR